MSKHSLGHQILEGKRGKIQRKQFFVKSSWPSKAIANLHTLKELIYLIIQEVEKGWTHKLLLKRCGETCGLWLYNGFWVDCDLRTRSLSPSGREENWECSESLGAESRGDMPRGWFVSTQGATSDVLLGLKEVRNAAVPIFWVDWVWFTKSHSWDLLVVQCSHAGGQGLNPGQGSRSHMLPKILVCS